MRRGTFSPRTNNTSAFCPLSLSLSLLLFEPSTLRALLLTLPLNPRRYFPPLAFFVPFSLPLETVRQLFARPTGLTDFFSPLLESPCPHHARAVSFPPWGKLISQSKQPTTREAQKRRKRKQRQTVRKRNEKQVFFSPIILFFPPHIPPQKRKTMNCYVRPRKIDTYVAVDF